MRRRDVGIPGEGERMAKEVQCIHAGFEDCEFLLRTEDEDELVRFVREHAERVHDVSVSPEHVRRIAREVE